MDTRTLENEYVDSLDSLGDKIHGYDARYEDELPDGWSVGEYKTKDGAVKAEYVLGEEIAKVEIYPRPGVMTTSHIVKFATLDSDDYQIVVGDRERALETSINAMIVINIKISLGGI